MANRPTSAIVTVNHLQLLVEQEKTALAREIHDDLGGHLLATAMDLADLKRRVGKSDQVALVKIERASASLNEAIDMMRRVTEELRPTLLDNVGLYAALRWQIKHVCHRSKLVCDAQLPDGELRLRPITAITLFRVGQEALIMAENHIGATQLDFTISVLGDAFTMQVQTDGVSAPPEPGSRSQLAMGFLRHRMDAMEGRLAVHFPADGGLRLIADVQLDTVSPSETQAVRKLELGSPGSAFPLTGAD